MVTIDDYDMRCVGLSCKRSSRCLRHYTEEDQLMPWTPVAFNVCQVQEQNQYIPIPSSEGANLPRQTNPARRTRLARR